MAQDILGKAVRIDEKQYNPKGAKVEVWTKGRHKYLKQEIQKGTTLPFSTIRYIDGDKISASLTDDEVIEAWLLDYNTQIKILNDNGANRRFYKVIQDPYSDDESITRVYGDKSPYYLNNGCKLFIEWTGRKPNPEFVLGTFSTAEAAGKNPVGPNRFLNNQSITSNKDQRTNLLPSSTWVVPTGEVNAALEPVPNYRDYSEITNKKITIHLPDGFTENGGKGYLILTEKDELRYSTDKTAVEDTSKYSNLKDSDIVSNMIWKFKAEVEKLHSIKTSDYDLKLCSPDSKACSLIPYKSPLEAPDNTPQQAAINDTPPPVPISSNKLKLSIQGLFENEDGTTPGLTSSVFEIKAKTDMPTFIVWSGEIPKTEEIDQFENLPELDEEYSETGFSSVEEQEWKPIITEIDGDFDPDTSKGEVEAGNFDNTPAPQSFVPATQTQKDFIKAAVTATLSRGGAHGRCGRFTFNMAKNYVRLLQGKSVQQGAGNAAGGNAKDSGYHQNLISMGYKIVSTESISKSNLINKIKTNGWAVGDVIVYWCTDGPSNDSHVKYGHTQIFTNGYHNTSGYRWSTDVVNNYGERGGGEFIYNSKTGNSWNLIYLQAPKTKKLNDVA